MTSKRNPLNFEQSEDSSQKNLKEAVTIVNIFSKGGKKHSILY